MKYWKVEKWVDFFVPIEFAYDSDKFRLLEEIAKREEEKTRAASRVVF